MLLVVTNCGIERPRHGVLLQIQLRSQPIPPPHCAANESRHERQFGRPLIQNVCRIERIMSGNVVASSRTRCLDNELGDLLLDQFKPGQWGNGIGL